MHKELTMPCPCSKQAGKAHPSRQVVMKPKSAILPTALPSESLPVPHFFVPMVSSSSSPSPSPSSSPAQSPPLLSPLPPSSRAIPVIFHPPGPDPSKPASSSSSSSSSSSNTPAFSSAQVRPPVPIRPSVRPPARPPVRPPVRPPSSTRPPAVPFLSQSFSQMQEPQPQQQQQQQPKPRARLHSRIGNLSPTALEVFYRSTLLTIQ